MTRAPEEIRGVELHFCDLECRCALRTAERTETYRASVERLRVEIGGLLTHERACAEAYAPYLADHVRRRLTTALEETAP